MSKQEFSVAVLGATGAVGEALIEILEEREFPVSDLHLLASERSAGKRIQFRGKHLKVGNVEEFDFSAVDIGLFSAGGSVSEKYAPVAAETGCVVIDNTSKFRYEDDIPLIVPEVNSKVLDDYELPGIIANPNCSTIQMLVALKPLHDEFVIERIDVSTFQAVSGTGKKATEELMNQIDAYEGNTEIKSSIYAKPIANNVLPHCDVFEENRYTKEENKLVKETHKILDPNIQVAATCARVPVLNGHSESVHIKTKRPISEDLAIKLLQKATVMEPENDEIFHSLALAYMSKNENKKAVGSMKKALNLNPKKDTYYFELGALMEKSGDFKGAIANMRQAIEINPLHSNAHNFLGYIYALEGRDLDRALEHLTKALTIQPRNGYFLDSLGWIYFKKGDSEKALTQIQKALIYTDPDPVLYDHLGDILFSLKNYDEAKGAWKNSRSLTLHQKGDLGGEMPNPQTLQEKIEKAKKLIQQSF